MLTANDNMTIQMCDSHKAGPTLYKFLESVLDDLPNLEQREEAARLLDKYNAGFNHRLKGKQGKDDVDS